jgi:peptidoglycan/xylan/chitin deacetylase (PgdA/CDA1 family)/GT2 family glycosyltransferase
VTEIDVVIPCYDLGRTLPEAIASVLAQTRPAREILVIDDGSTDPLTCDLLASLAAPRTRVVRIEHAGVAVARNHGAALARAPLLLFLDADDRLADTYLEKAAARLDADPELAFISCEVQAFEGATYRWRPPALDAIGTLTRGSVHISTLLRRSLWDAVGGFDPELPAYEDLDFWMRALATGARGEILDEALLYYRVRPRSRYRMGIEPETYRAAMQRILGKHTELLRARGVEALLAKEDFLVDLLDYRETLERDREALRAELAALQARVRAARARPERRPGRGVILAYHRVAALEPDTHGLCVAPADFAEHMRYLGERATPMPLDALARAARAGALPPNAVAVTLDDGYLDALTAAAPILARAGVPATFFVTTAELDEPHEAWHDIVERILLGTPGLPARVAVAGLDLDLATPAARAASLLELHGALLGATPAARRAILAELAARCGVALAAVRPERRLLVGDEVRALARAPGCVIGSHSEHHLFLPEHPREVQRDELVRARARLEALLDRPVTEFCYPYGATSPALAEVVRDTGHLLAVTVEPGLVSSASDPFLLPRHEIRSGGLEALRAALEERVAP